jgi:hypothetical protein
MLMSFLNILVNKSKEVFKKCIFVNIVTLKLKILHIFNFSTNNVLFENLKQYSLIIKDQNKVK